MINTFSKPELEEIRKEFSHWDLPKNEVWSGIIRINNQRTRG